MFVEGGEFCIILLCHFIPPPKEIYYEELAHASMEGEKSHYLTSASWRPKKTSGVVQSEAEGLRTRGAPDLIPSPRAGEDQYFSSSSQAERRIFPSSTF